MQIDLTVDIERGVVPISKAGSSLAALIRQTRATHRPIIVTQKGYPTAVILDIALYAYLRQLADAYLVGESDGQAVQEVTCDHHA